MCKSGEDNVALRGEGGGVTFHDNFFRFHAKNFNINLMTGKKLILG